MSDDLGRPVDRLSPPPTMVYTVGLPASGKTTEIRRWVGENPTGRARINRDALRAMMFGEHHDHDNPVQEAAVTAVQHAAIRALLTMTVPGHGTGLDVGVDDTNLNPRVRVDLQLVAWAAGADVRVVDKTDISTEECIVRDCVRLATGEGGYVGEEVIRSKEPWVHMWRAAGGGPLPGPDEA